MSGSKSSKREAAIAALLQHTNVADAAKQAGIGHRTLQRWINVDSDFRAALMDARNRLVTAAINQINLASTEAVSVLRKIMNDEESPSRSRVSAAKAILEIMIRAVEINEFNSRLAELERQLTTLAGGSSDEGR